MVRINKKKIIENELGERLQSFGFVFDGYKDKSWHFSKQKNAIKQEIVILEYRYDSSYYTFVLVGLRTVTASMIDDSKKFLGEYWKADNEEEFKAVIKLFSDLIITDGLNKLEEASEESEKDRVKKIIAKMVFEKHEQFYKEYLEYHPDVITNDFSLETIEKWFDAFSAEYEFYKCKSMEVLTEKDINEYAEIVSFLGTILEKNLGGVWKKNETGVEYTVIIDDMKAYRKTINLINVISIAIEKHDFSVAKSKIANLCTGLNF